MSVADTGAQVGVEELTEAVPWCVEVRRIDKAHKDRGKKYKKDSLVKMWVSLAPPGVQQV